MNRRAELLDVLREIMTFRTIDSASAMWDMWGFQSTREKGLQRKHIPSFGIRALSNKQSFDY